MKTIKILLVFSLISSFNNFLFSQFVENEDPIEIKDFGEIFNPAIADSFIKQIVFSGNYPDFQVLETPILGWSKDGKIAFVYFWEPKEPIGTLAKLMILDLKSDNELLALELYNGSSINTENISLFRLEMKKNKIIYQRTKIKQFPAFFDNDTVFAGNDNKMLYIVKKNTDKKIELDSPDDRLSFEGYAINPFEKRMAIYYHMGCGNAIAEISEYQAYSSFFELDLKKKFRGNIKKNEIIIS
jgi:hypothetical protein